jgi:hypothetical protein
MEKLYENKIRILQGNTKSNQEQPYVVPGMQWVWIAAPIGNKDRKLKAEFYPHSDLKMQNDRS